MTSYSKDDSVPIYDEATAAFLWRNGELVRWEDALIHIGSVGHASVAGIFEGIKAYWSEADDELYIFRLDEHLDRFISSIKMVRYGFQYSKADLREAIIELLRANEYRRDIYIRPYVFQAGIVRELLQAVPGKPTELVIDCWPFTSYADPATALDVCVSSWMRISDNMLPPRLKCFANYHNGRLAAMDATVAGYDWPIMLDSLGKVTEGPGACFAMVRNGYLLTTPVTSGILESITRSTVLELATEDLGLQLQERVIDRTELYLADEIFFLGTGWEIMPVASVDRLAVNTPAPGPITTRISQRYKHIVRNGHPSHPEWRTPVWKRS